MVHVWDGPSNRSRGCPLCFDWLLGSYSSGWIALPNLSTGGDAWSKGNLIDYALLEPMGGLLLSEGLQKRIELGSEGEDEGGSKRRRGRGDRG